MLEKYIKDLPIGRPQLASYDRLVPYLKRIDDARTYSNFGPLVNEFEERISARYGSVSSACSATSALTALLLALGLPKGHYAILPSWTFIATAHAIRAAGLIPYFMDVDETWTLSADIKLPEHTVCVIPVASLGEPINYSRWERFQEEKGVPVIIDAAGGFDSLSWHQCKLPIVVSTHATKVLSTGEGGFVSATKDLAKKIRQITNFGFSGDRVARRTAMNAKMSEYNAAVGLAELDGWEAKRAKWKLVRKYYADAFESIGASPTFNDSWAGSLFCVKLPVSAVPVIERLKERGVEARQLWGSGCHTHTAYLDAPHTDLPETQKLVDKVILLPFAVDMTKEDVEYVKRSVESCM